MSKKKDTIKKHIKDSPVPEKEQKELKEQLSTAIEKSQSIVNRYLLLFAVAISSLTIIGALLIAQHYINPVRDEQLYIEGESQTSFKQVNQEKLQILEQSLEETSVEVDTDFVPNRKNPFSE